MYIRSPWLRTALKKASGNKLGFKSGDSCISNRADEFKMHR
jgi:hypothetical protein